MAARASSTVRSASRPDSTASRRSSGSSARKPLVRPPNEGPNRRDHQTLSSTAATSSTTSRTYRMTMSGTWKPPPGCAPCGRGLPRRFGPDADRRRGLNPAAQVQVQAEEDGYRHGDHARPEHQHQEPAQLGRHVVDWYATAHGPRPAPVGQQQQDTQDHLEREPDDQAVVPQRPFHRGLVTAPRSPATPRMTSSVSGSTSGQDGPRRALGPGSGARVSPVVPGPVVPGWLVIPSRF